jgi:hypothetical protein
VRAECSIHILRFSAEPAYDFVEFRHLIAQIVDKVGVVKSSRTTNRGYQSEGIGHDEGFNFPASFHRSIWWLENFLNRFEVKLGFQKLS